VLDLIAAGRNNADIAATLVLSPKTVQNHISNIFTKLQVTDRARAIVMAREAGLGREPGREHVLLLQCRRRPIDSYARAASSMTAAQIDGYLKPPARSARILGPQRCTDVVDGGSLREATQA
jgi:hypothetical protein